MEVIFSIVIANYNYGRFLADAIRSVLVQCGEPIKCPDGIIRLPLKSGRLVELIVCDAESTDNSVEVISENVPALAWWCSEKDRGQSDAFNKGFSHATGKFLTWLNADDLMLPGALEAVERCALQNPTCRWIAGGMVECDKELFVTRVYWGHRFSYIRANINRCITVGGPSSFFTKDLLESVGGVDESLHFTMDIDLWMKFYFHAHEQYQTVGHPIWAMRYHAESKMTGPTIDPTSALSVKNRTRLEEERRLRSQRFGTGGILSRIMTRIPVSFVDSCKCYRLSHQIVGRHLSFAFRGTGMLHRILLSNSIQEYITGLSAVASEIHVFNTWYRKTFDSSTGVVVIPQEVGRAYRVCARYVEDHGIDVLYAQGFSSLVFLYKVRRCCKRRIPSLYVTCHAPTVWDTWWKAFLLIFVSSLVADGIVYLVDNYKRKWAWLTRLLGVSSKCFHVPNPVDITRFKDGSPCNYGPSKKVLTLGNIGVLSPRKNQILLIQIAAALRKRGYDVNISIGGDVSNWAAGYDEELRACAKYYKVEDVVRLDGRIAYDDVPSWMRKLDVYVCTSLAEVMPFSILEAMATGLPVVAHDIAGIGEEVSDGINGRLLKSLEVTDYVEACEDVLNNRAKYSENARRRVEENFTMQCYAKRMAAVFG